MAKRSAKWTFMILIAAILINGTIAPTAAYTGSGDPVADQVQALIPLSQSMVDRAITRLSGGLENMKPSERALFAQLFDPGNTGDIDERFVADVLVNYRRIRDRLDEPLIIAQAPEKGRCQGMRLYYTNLAKVYVCPYFDNESSQDRKARVLIHEAVHMALLVVDRPYFHKNTYSTRYQALTPRGTWTAQIPLVGPLFREIAHSDTLYHPDAYAWFAVELAAD
jgi:hypothetical protein